MRKPRGAGGFGHSHAAKPARIRARVRSTSSIVTGPLCYAGGMPACAPRRPADPAPPSASPFAINVTRRRSELADTSIEAPGMSAGVAGQGVLVLLIHGSYFALQHGCCQAVLLGGNFRFPASAWAGATWRIVDRHRRLRPRGNWKPFQNPRQPFGMRAVDMTIPSWGNGLQCHFGN
jgi:hypothetical protein